MTTSVSLVLAGGSVVDGSGSEPMRADVAIEGARVSAIGDLDDVTAERRIDVSGRLVFPGFIDAHSHGDSLLADPAVQEAYLRQGVTTVVLGQDGVSYAPGGARAASYAGRYFAAINGATPHDLAGGASVARILERLDGIGAINAGYLIPAGSLRAGVVGSDSRAATSEELAAMVSAVSEGMDDGALGLSTGLDYVPGRFADADELAALCAPVGRAGGVYASHLRGYASDTVGDAIDELARICAASGARGHISHLHGTAERLQGFLGAALSDRGVEVSYDSYPYLRGSTIVAMLLLPSEFQSDGIDATLARLADPAVRERMRSEWLPVNPRLPSIRLSYLGDPAWSWAEGLSLPEAAERHGTDVTDFVCDALVACDLAVGAVMGNGADRTEDDMRGMLRGRGQLAGSDAIYLGSRPHPRGWGAFARMLGHHVRELGDWSWGEAAWHLAGHSAERFGLTGRGRVEAGGVADLAVVDPRTVADTATYDEPRSPAVGVELVLTGGRIALDENGPTGARSGRALRFREDIA
jgi:N-acyl-D-amino-acid deacylase